MRTSRAASSFADAADNVGSGLGIAATIICEFSIGLYPYDWTVRSLSPHCSLSLFASTPLLTSDHFSTSILRRGLLEGARSGNIHAASMTDDLVNI